MKSYQEHLKTLLNNSPTNKSHRASAIFPIFYSAQVEMKLIFFNYWKLKRNIDELFCELILRDSLGQTISKKSFHIDEVKAYEISLKDWLKAPYPVIGSLEIQFSSPENLVFPYPAVTVVYQGKNFCTFVHAAQRLYNDQQDDQSCFRTSIIESGFNIYANSSSAPFITLINGADELYEQIVAIEAINLEQKSIHKSYPIDCKAYQTHYLYLKDWDELQKHLGNQVGCLKVSLFKTKTFPRLIVGNYNSIDQSMSVTHTYYDLSASERNEDYWQSDLDDWHPMALMLPLKVKGNYFTKIYFYPIYSPTEFWIDIEIYDAKGHCLYQHNQWQTISSKSAFQYLRLPPLQHTNQSDLSIRMIAHPIEGYQIPARIKIGYDMGFSGQGFPCNICTNFQPANPSLENKPSAFRWAPMMPANRHGSIWCLNDSPKKNYSRKALVEYTFYRAFDEKTLSFQQEIPPHGYLVIEHTDTTAAFFQDQIGWCVIKSDNPNIFTYYFSEHDQKMIGGDHGF